MHTPISRQPITDHPLVPSIYSPSHTKIPPLFLPGDMGRKDKKSTPIIEPPPPPTNSSSATSDTAAVSATSSDATSSSSEDLPPTTPAVTPAAVDNSDDDSDDDSPPKIKPLSPLTKPTSSKQSRSKPVKRPAQTDTKISDKRVKNDPNTTPGPSETPQKVLFQRVWSDEDEIVILKGMIDYRGNKGIDPMSNVDDFLEFIKNSLHLPDANKGQIVSKVRRLKKRFVNAHKKKISDPHEARVFELSKKIWRGPETDVSIAQLVDDVNKKAVEEPKANGEVVVVAVAKEGNVDASVEFGFEGVDGVILEEAMKRLGEGEKRELRGMVEKSNVAYLEAYLLKLKVMEIAAKKTLDAIKTDKS